ncbi:hypothetical protein B0H11DRAFT_1918294 [Mycena galericulata]|nr:hypothetical protein B0H11DRAFT_1918294 [Mycena galericulata]
MSRDHVTRPQRGYGADLYYFLDVTDEIEKLCEEDPALFKCCDQMEAVEYNVRASHPDINHSATSDLLICPPKAGRTPYRTVYNITFTVARSCIAEAAERVQLSRCSRSRHISVSREKSFQGIQEARILKLRLRLKAIAEVPHRFDNPLLQNSSSRPPPPIPQQGVKRSAEAMMGGASSTRPGTSAGMGMGLSMAGGGGGGMRQPLGTLVLDVQQQQQQHQHQQDAKRVRR